MLYLILLPCTKTAHNEDCLYGNDEIDMEIWKIGMEALFQPCSTTF